MSILKTASLLVACTLVAGCSKSPQDPAVRIDRIDSFVVHERDSLYIGDFLSLDEGPDSLFWAADYVRRNIVGIDDSGEIIVTFGSQGRGPGEFENLFHVISLPGGFITRERGRYSRFDSRYDFIDTHMMPEGFVDESFWGMVPYDDLLLIGGTSFSDVSGSITATESDPAVIVLDSAFQHRFSFGHFPESYRSNEWTMRDRDVAVGPRGLVGVVFRLSSELHIYQMDSTSARLIDVIDFSSLYFKKPDLSTTLGLSRSEQIDFLESTSLVNRVFFVSRDTIVVYYANPGKDWNGLPGDDSTSKHYLVVHSLGTKNVTTQEIPGPVLGVDAAGRLLIRLSNTDGNREIGRFDVAPQP